MTSTNSDNLIAYLEKTYGSTVIERSDNDIFINVKKITDFHFNFQENNIKLDSFINFLVDNANNIKYYKLIDMIFAMYNITINNLPEHYIQKTDNNIIRWFVEYQINNDPFLSKYLQFTSPTFQEDKIIFKLLNISFSIDEIKKTTLVDFYADLDDFYQFYIKPDVINKLLTCNSKIRSNYCIYKFKENIITISNRIQFKLRDNNLSISERKILTKRYNYIEPFINPKNNPLISTLMDLKEKEIIHIKDIVKLNIGDELMDDYLIKNEHILWNSLIKIIINLDSTESNDKNRILDFIFDIEKIHEEIIDKMIDKPKINTDSNS